MRGVSEINPDALQIARMCDEERKAGHTKGILHGIPFLVKDVYMTTDRTQTTGMCRMVEVNE